MKTKDILHTDLVYVLPHAIKWFYRLVINQTIRSLRSVLYLHGHPEPDIRNGTTAVLLLHGLYGHPYTMLHLADIAQHVVKGPVFSIHLSYNHVAPQLHRNTLKQAVNDIEDFVKKKGGNFQGIILVGHSIGATEAAYQAFVERDPRLLGVISIAGRLKVVPSRDKACRECLKPMVEEVYQGIQKHPQPSLYQIVGDHDWNAPMEAIAIRRHQNYCHVVENAMHFNVLYHPETEKKFGQFLAAICDDQLNAQGIHSQNRPVR